MSRWSLYHARTVAIAAAQQGARAAGAETGFGRPWLLRVGRSSVP